MIQSTRAVLLTLAIALAGFACGADEEQPAAHVKPPTPAAAPAPAKAPANPKPAPKAAIRPPAGQSKPVTSAAEQLLAGTDELPRDYPDDGPIYPGSTPSRARQLPDKGLSVMFRTKDSPMAVYQFMGEFLPEHGWEIYTSQPLSTGYVIQGAMPSGRRVNVITSILDGGKPSEVTMIAVTVSRK